MNNTEELYYSNNGRGPGIARVISIDNGTVTLERKKSEKTKTWKRFTLPEK